jgi:hypothetical protein
MPLRRLLVVVPALLWVALAFAPTAAQEKPQIEIKKDVPQPVPVQPVPQQPGDKKVTDKAGDPVGDGKKITDKMGLGDISGQSEVRFTDESVVRMTILQKELEVLTKYGKLVVPTEDIVKIDFGLHIPIDLEKKIAKAIDDLGSENYKTREVAVKDLVGWGPFAYPQVYKASKSELPEVQKRASLALDKLKSKYPARNLRTREEDVIVTPNFTVVGRITTPTVKAKAENFGELEMQVTKLRAVRSLTAFTEAEVTIDAAKYSMPNMWMDTNYEVRQGMRLVLTATGQVNLWPQNGGFICGPSGFDQNGGFGGRGNQNFPGALIGRIGESGAQFFVGDRYDGTSTTEGKLYLNIRQSPWNPQGTTGSYTVKITPKSEFGGD